MDNTDEILQSPENESAIQALKRYDQVLSKKNSEVHNEKKVQKKAPDKESTIKSVEARLGFNLPVGYKDFLMSHGGFTFGSDRGVFSLFSGLELEGILKAQAEGKYDCRLGVIDYINYLWEGREDLNEALQNSDAQKLNLEYYIFGLVHVDSNSHRYIFMNRSGQCGVFHYDQDYLEELVDDHLTPMLQGQFTAQDFDKLVAGEIQRFIKLLK